MTAEQKFAARIPQEDYNRLRVLAAMKGQSINAALCDVISDYLDRWESEHGQIPTLPQ